MTGRCCHYSTTPVLLATGDHVADLCTSCLMQLEPRYNCEDCDWVDITTIAGPEQKLRARACRVCAELSEQP